MVRRTGWWALPAGIATLAPETGRTHDEEVTEMGQQMVEGSVAYVAPGRGGSVWIGDRELGTFKQTGADTGGLVALLEVTGLPGSGPPPHLHRRGYELYPVLEGGLEGFEIGRAHV